MENDFFTYIDMMANEPTITFMSILTEIITFILVSGVSIATVFITYKLKPVQPEYKNHYIISGIILILVFNLIYTRLPNNPYYYFVPFLIYLRALLLIAVLSVIEYLILSSKKTNKKQMIKALVLQGILAFAVYNIINWILSIILSHIISSVL